MIINAMAARLEEKIPLGRSRLTLKVKAVPLHAMKALGRREGIALAHSRSRH
jgi:hypothetical protein